MVTGCVLCTRPLMGETLLRNGLLLCFVLLLELEKEKRKSKEQLAHIDIGKVMDMVKIT